MLVRTCHAIAIFFSDPLFVFAQTAMTSTSSSSCTGRASPLPFFPYLGVRQQLFGITVYFCRIESSVDGDSTKATDEDGPDQDPIQR